MSAFDVSGASFGGCRTALIAASPISTGSGHSRPVALALSTTIWTVVLEHLHENAMFLMLIPEAWSLGISRYLTTCLSFLRWHGALAPHGNCRKEDAPYRASHYYVPTMLGSACQSDCNKHQRTMVELISVDSLNLAEE